MHLSAIGLCAAAVLGLSNALDSRQACADSYTICSPPGATSVQTPKIGDASLQQLFVDLIGSSLPDGNQVDALSKTDGGGTASLCCVSSLTCLTLSQLLIPFCYDRFTTNFYLPDGSYGTVTGGKYITEGGDSVNLISGSYTKADGTVGNIYDNNETAKPNTTTLKLPVQFTATGIGSAIPASALGAVVTVTYTTVVSGSDIPATTIAPSTLPGTVIMPITETWTTTIPASPSQTTVLTPTSSAASTTSNGGPPSRTPDRIHAWIWLASVELFIAAIFFAH